MLSVALGHIFAGHVCKLTIARPNKHVKPVLWQDPGYLCRTELTLTK